MAASSPPPTLSQSLALVWRTLRSMRTALILLLLLALASVAGSLVPQSPNSPARVLAYRQDHPLAGALYQRLGLFDVFGTWWFALITTLLFVSLVACLVPRTRALLRAVGQRPVQAREIDAFPQYRERRVSSAPGDAIVASERILRRRFFRVARDPDRPALAAEKGILREGGSLLFHWAFILVLIGVIYGKGTGFSGRAVIVEGDTWVDAAANYDGQIRAGRFFDGRFTGIGVRLIDFEDRYERTGQPMDFVSRVELLDADGEPIRREDIRVNHPAGIEGLRLYQYGFGWAPVVVVRRDGGPIASEPIVFVQDEAPEGVPQLAMPWRGVLKLPSLDPQVGIELELWPDSRAFVQMLETGEPVAMTSAFQPLIRYAVWSGRLTDPSPLSLDTTNMTREATGIVGADQVVALEDGAVVDDPAAAGGLTIGFPELRKYTVLQVSRDAGVPFVLLAAILILLGLLPALYGSRRKVWVRAEPDGEGSVLKVGGFALQRKARFEEEFPRLVDALARAAGEAPAPQEERVGIR
ncbi:MAG TPA: cytochrome c biogenesis protein ResB [Actinomycetota bacterium]